MPERGPYRLTFWRAFFFLTLAAGLPAIVIRYTQGLGAVSNLSDDFPWGLWIGFAIVWLALIVLTVDSVVSVRSRSRRLARAARSAAV